MIVGEGATSVKPIIVTRPVDVYGAVVDKSYLVLDQSVASDTWEFSHNFGRLPVVTVLDNDGNVLNPDNIRVDLNTVSVTFATPVAGRIVVASVGGAYSDPNTILVNPASIAGYPDGTIVLRTS